MTQYARPGQDILIGNWTDEGTVDNDGNLYTSVDEVTKDDDDSYINADDTATTCELKLSSVTDPQVGTSHILHIWFRSDGSGGPEKLDVRLLEATTEICSLANQTNRSGSYADVGYTLSEGEANSITDYSDLRIELTQDSVGSGEWIRVTQCYLEVPDAPVGATLVAIVKA